MPPALDAVGMGAQGDGVGLGAFPVLVPAVGCSVLTPSSSSLEPVILFSLLSRKGAWMCCCSGARWQRAGVSLFAVSKVG